MKKLRITSLTLLAILTLFSCTNRVTEQYNTTVSIAEDYKTKMMYLDSVIKSNNPADYEWISALNQIKLPETIQPDSTINKIKWPYSDTQVEIINVYFKYNQIVNGYEVTARWLPFEYIECETGYLIMNFRNTTNGQSFQYIETEKYNSFDTDNITFSDGFKGYYNGDVFHFDYLLSESDKGLGYYSPFQFLDVDFDGEKELLINGWCQSRGGNIYEVYKIKGNTIQLMDYPPFKGIQNSAEFDFKKKKIIINKWNTAFNAINAIYRLSSDNKITDKVYPETLDDLGKWELEAYYNAPTGKFRLDSIYEYSETREGAFKYVYANKKGKMTLVETRKSE